jgi:biotin transport system substrate-specific component
MQARVPAPVLIDVVLPGEWIQTRVQRLAVDAGLIVSFAFLMTLVAQLAIRIPTTTVPITGQTFGVLLTGGVLGSRRGPASMVVYLLLGMVMPAFAPGSSVMVDKNVHAILPWSGTEGFFWDMSSGGYLLGFVLAAYLVGKLAEWGWDRGSKVLVSMLVGNIAIYLVGLVWLAVFVASATIPGTELTYYDAIAGSNVADKTLKGGLYPFIGGDAVKLFGAAMLLPGTWALVRWLKGEKKKPDETG